MRKITLVRSGVACVLLGGLVAGGVFAVGCSSSSSNGGPTNTDDGGPDGSQPQPGDDGSTPVTDAGTDADAAPAPPVHGKIILVHASAYAPPLRFCFGSVKVTDGGDAGAVTITPVAAAPNTALGVPPGTGGAASDTAVDLADRTLEIYGIASAKLTTETADAGAAELTCDKLIGANALAADAGGLGLQPGIDYWDLGQLPAGTIADGTTTLVAVTGCAPGDPGSNNPDYNCPQPYDVATGNLKLWSARLDTTTALDGGSIGAQFAYASYPFQSFATLATGGPTTATAGFYVTSLVTPDAGTVGDAGDAGDGSADAAAPVPVPETVPYPVAGNVTYGQLAPTSLAPVSNVTFDGNSGFFVSAVTADGGSSPIQVAVSLPTIQALSAPNLTTGEFANGVGYVFVLVGDPQLPPFVGVDGGASGQDAGSFNPLSAHILGFPTNPPFGK